MRCAEPRGDEAAGGAAAADDVVVALGGHAAVSSAAAPWAGRREAGRIASTPTGSVIGPPSRFAGTDVRAILGGHFHFTSHSTFAGIPVSVASATCYTSELSPVDRMVSGIDAHHAFTMLHLYEDRVVHSVVPAEDGTEVDGRGTELLEAFLALSP